MTGRTISYAAMVNKSIYILRIISLLKTKNKKLKFIYIHNTKDNVAKPDENNVLETAKPVAPANKRPNTKAETKEKDDFPILAVESIAPFQQSMPGNLVG